jgi:beta-lactamase class A
MDLSLPEYEQEEGSGILARLESSVSLSIRDLVVLMIVESDNLATNCLLELVGMQGINETMIQLGLSQTRVNRPIEDFEALREDTSNPTTSQEIASLLIEIYKGNLPYSDLMVEILKKQRYTSRIPFFLPDDNEDLEIAHKTGTLDGIVHDVGLVLHPCFDYVVALMTKNQLSISNTTIAIARISELCFEYMKISKLGQQLGRFLDSAPNPQIGHR